MQQDTQDTVMQEIEQIKYRLLKIQWWGYKPNSNKIQITQNSMAELQVDKDTWTNYMQRFLLIISPLSQWKQLPSPSV